MQAVVNGYGGRMGQQLPPHLVDPDSSAIRVMPHSVFEKMSAKEVIEILRTQNVVLTGVPAAKIAKWCHRPWKQEC